MEQVLEVEVRGIAPLLMHRYPEENGAPKSTRRTGAPNWESEAESAKYVLPDGTLYQPSTHIEGALIKSASNFLIAGRGKRTYKDLIKGALVVLPEAIPHVHRDHKVDARLVVNPSTRGRIMRYRPRLDRWSLAFTIHILDEQLSTETVQQILDHAGRYVGIGDYRPKFGRFTVAKFGPVAT
jgi:hypothetical protein